MRKVFFADFPFEMVTDATHLFFTKNAKFSGEYTGQWMLGTLGFNQSKEVEFVVKARSKECGRVRKLVKEGGEFASNHRRIFHFAGVEVVG